MHLAVDSLFADVRRTTLAVLCKQSAKYPELINHVIFSSLVARLTKGKPAHTKENVVAEDHEAKDVKLESRLCAVYLACGVFGSDMTQEKREPLLVNFVVLGHHPAIGM